MISHIEGRVAEKRAGELVIDVGGVGFLLLCPASTVAAAPAAGAVFRCYTHFSVYEGGMDLYGFSTREELNCFERLLGVTGVGPKAALSVLSTLPADRLAVCVAAGDAKAIASAPGVGLKTAQKIILELKDKLAKEFASGEPLPDGVPSDGADDASDAVNALVVLGYSRAQALGALKGLDSALPLEIRIREALKKLY